MSKYDDDQCERCGGVRVAKSTLCGDCLEKERAFLVKRIKIKNVAIEGKETRIFDLQAFLKEAMNYGFKKNQENIKQLKYIKELESGIREVREDGTNRV